MIEGRFDDVRLNADVSHAGGGRAAEIVHRPSLCTAALVQGSLGGKPVVETVLADAEQVVVEGALRSALNNLPSESRQCEFERPVVLCPLGWQCPSAIVDIKLAPSHAADFVTTRPGDNQQTNYL